MYKNVYVFLIILSMVQQQYIFNEHHQNKMKNIQINIASLTTAQKKMCVQLIAQSNLKFQQKNNQYIAQIKIDPQQLKKQKIAQKQTKTHLNIKNNENVMPNGKKLLRRVIKIGDLSTLQSLHNVVEVYIYPKKLSYLQLCQLIELSYEKFWNQNKKKNIQIKKINFSQWFYNNIILMMKDKLRIQQLLVNFIDSLNFYTIKDDSFKIFYLFLSGKMPIDALLYFLVLRGLLQDISGDKNMEKSNHGPFHHIYPYKLKNNPFQRQISEQIVIQLLKVLLNGGLSCSRNKSKSFQAIHQNLTQYMYFDEQKRKNFISYFILIQVMLNQFMDSQGSTVNMSISNIDIQQSEASSLISYQFEPDEEHLKKNTTRQQTHRQKEQYIMQIQPFEQQKIADRMAIQQQIQNNQLLREVLYTKLQETYNKLNVKMSQATKLSIQAILSTIIQFDKLLWIRFRGNIEESQLYLIQKLQEQYRIGKSTNIILNKLVKNILLIPIIRKHIINDIQL